ncbi:restriction endonuclease subunit S [Lactobacillus crispatus]|uniref:restriction endonuclease subunit S n=1 Tax=Lactobacillus crispatus TaxID=47770 RepID=UPI001874CA67|nr:restriction endonuclease subunit S [Lactobacillus crispatus]MBE5057739.1 restriction endonuclease subunit S [Lactobacillus crispatus]
MKVKLGKVIQLNPREQISKGKVAKKIAMDNLEPYTREVSGYDLDIYKGGTKFRNKDTLLARITPCLENGKTAYVNILDDNEVAFGSTEYFVLRAKKELIDPLYLYYLSISRKFRTVAIKSMTGTSGRQRVQKDSILNYEFDLPQMEEQKRIAKMIGCLDDKKVLNDKINDNLSKLQQLNLSQLINRKLYKIVKIGDLEIIVSDHVANGSFKSLKDNVSYFDNPNYALFIRNIDFKKDLDGNKKYIDKKSYNYLKKSHLFGGEVVISNVADVGSVHRVPFIKKPMVVGNNQIFIKSKHFSMTDYLYVYFQSFWGQSSISSITSGSAQQKFNKTDFRSLEIPIPSEKWIQSNISPYVTLQDKIFNENQSLKQIKATLLNHCF